MKRYIGIILLVALTITASAQVTMKSSYNLTSDTTVNAGTTYLSAASPKSLSASVVVQVNVTKISGTVGGVISLQGSTDGTNYKALNTAETQTALATITATDASNVYHWRLTGNPFPYYRVSWVGTGTMSARFTAAVFAR